VDLLSISSLSYIPPFSFSLFLSPSYAASETGDGCNCRAFGMGWFSIVFFLPKVSKKGYNWRFMDVGGLQFLSFPLNGKG
jgi:hypothetical protein